MFRSGKNLQHATVVFGQEIARQLVITETGGAEMKIVQDGVADSCVDDVAGQ